MIKPAVLPGVVGRVHIHDVCLSTACKLVCVTAEYFDIVKALRVYQAHTQGLRLYRLLDVSVKMPDGVGKPVDVVYERSKQYAILLFRQFRAHILNVLTDMPYLLGKVVFVELAAVVF